MPECKKVKNQTYTSIKNIILFSPVRVSLRVKKLFSLLEMHIYLMCGKKRPLGENKTKIVKILIYVARMPLFKC